MDANGDIAKEDSHPLLAKKQSKIVLICCLLRGEINIILSGDNDCKKLLCCDGETRDLDTDTTHPVPDQRMKRRVHQF